MGNKDSIDATTPKWFRARVSLAIISTSIRSITITSSRFRFYVTTEAFSRLLPLKWKCFSGFDDPFELSAYSKFGHFVALPQPQKHKSQGFSPWTSVEHPPFAGNAGECHEPDATGSASPRGGAVVEVIFYGCNHGQIHRKILGSDWKIIYTRAIIGRNWGLLPGITMGLKPP